MTADYSTLSADQFSPHVGQTFRFLEPEGRSAIVEVELTMVGERPEFTPRWAKRTSFALKFETLGSSELWNGSYLIDHPVDGPMGPFYVVRTAPRDPARACFEVVFN
ncbi:hypothetical protein GBZ48_19255 [Azospirillum melinis]|uniref:DUF6916 domain-containing protein n=1 Tax=Azospirillum melinis TaxID=328839 RepID=A0ABX2KF57_9PROT|nr:hypothetical protein [Azospirillum melinis]MBP2307285.1 hypothetical protein [Azospirillum melinis]NUB01401.1 hypothetical protein [Azospirillum melinis]